MTKGNAVSLTTEKTQPQKKEYDFTGMDPSAILTPDEFEHFEDAMMLKNKSEPSGKVGFSQAGKALSKKEIDIILS